MQDLETERGRDRERETGSIFSGSSTLLLSSLSSETFSSQSCISRISAVALSKLSQEPVFDILVRTLVEENSRKIVGFSFYPCTSLSIFLRPMAGAASSLRGWKCFAVIMVGLLVIAASFVSAENAAERATPRTKTDDSHSLLASMRKFLWQKGRVGYTHVWPVKTFLGL